MQSDNLIFRLFGENFTKNAILKIMLALFTIFVMCKCFPCFHKKENTPCPSLSFVKDSF